MTLAEAHAEYVVHHEVLIENLARQMTALRLMPLDLARYRARQEIMKVLPMKSRIFFETGKLPTPHE